jgi:hypothetical protein
MGAIKKFNLKGAVDQWSRQINAVPSFTESDSEQFKYDLLDMIDDLISRGLDEEEAFLVASRRYNRLFDLQEEFESENMPKLQLRRITQALAGVMVFFVLFFLMHSTSKLLFLALNEFNHRVRENMSYIYYYIWACHFIIVFLTGTIYFFGRKCMKRMEAIKIKPKHFFGLYLAIICLFGLDYWLFDIIISDLLSFKVIVFQFNKIIDYSRYTFPFIFILCFVLLYKKYYAFGFKENGKNVDGQGLTGKENGNPFTGHIPEGQIEGLVKTGLKREEAELVAAKRNGLKLTQHNGPTGTERPFKAALRVLLIVLSGVLFYFLLYYFLNASARIVLTVLNYINNDNAFSFQWTRWYVMAYHLIFIFFTLSIYIKDVNLINKIERIKIEPLNTLLLFFSIIILAIIDRRFFSLSRNAFNNDPALLYHIESIFVFVNFTFPFLVSTCFLFLFTKYYRENMKIG